MVGDGNRSFILIFCKHSSTLPLADHYTCSDPIPLLQEECTRACTYLLPLHTTSSLHMVAHMHAWCTIVQEESTVVVVVLSVCTCARIPSLTRRVQVLVRVHTTTLSVSSSTTTQYTTMHACCVLHTVVVCTVVHCTAHC